MPTSMASLRKMKGSVMIIVALSLFVILGMAGLAIDLGHSFSSKTRLQNSVDAAALSAAMKLLKDLQDNLGSNTPVSTAAANAAGTATHQANLASFGSSWLTSPAAIEFCWSTDLQDFSNCQSIASFSALTADASAVFFVRARVASTALQNFFIQVMGVGNTRSVGAVSVAGTSGNIHDCNIAPFFVCNNGPLNPSDTSCGNPPCPDSNCLDDSDSDSKPDCYGNRVTTSSSLTNADLNEFLDADNLATPTVDERALDFSKHFFVLKVGSDNPPATPVSSCPATTPFQTNNCLVIKDRLAVDDAATPLVNEADPAGFPIVINKAAQTDWEFNPSITLNGNFGYLELIDVNGGNTNPGAPGMKYNVLEPNSCVERNTAASQTGNISSLDAAFNALFGEPKPPYSTNGNPMPNPISEYSDFVGSPTVPFYQPMSFNFYRHLYADNPSWTDESSHYRQRLRNIPVIQCPNPLSGSQPSLQVKGYACFFFSRKMYGNSETGKLKNNEDFVIAEHVDNRFCPPIIGVGQSNPTSILKANVVLYQYYQSADS
ncbi:MAG: pilus assembly protein TadG-related protein [Gammaproteobacteria bacterium]